MLFQEGGSLNLPACLVCLRLHWNTKESRIEVLRNASRRIECKQQSLWIAGVDEYSYGRSDIQKALAGIPAFQPWPWEGSTSFSALLSSGTACFSVAHIHLNKFGPKSSSLLGYLRTAGPKVYSRADGWSPSACCF
jgi:hypothetical protein